MSTKQVCLCVARKPTPTILHVLQNLITVPPSFVDTVNYHAVLYRMHYMRQSTCISAHTIKIHKVTLVIAACRGDSIRWGSPRLVPRTTTNN